jgi:RNA-binding protein 23/39
MATVADALPLQGPNGETLHSKTDDVPNHKEGDTKTSGASNGAKITHDLSTSSSTVDDKTKENAKINDKETSTPATAADNGASKDGSKDTGAKTVGQKSVPSTTNQRASSSNGTIKRTEEEEKLRKRLHAKREEDRLRDLIKRKRDSFRKSIDNGSSGDKLDIDVKGKNGDEEGIVAENSKVDGEIEKLDGNGNGAVIETSTNGKNDRNDHEKSNGHHHRDRRESHDDRNNRRGHHPHSDRHRHDRRPPYGHHPPPVRNGRDVRSGVPPQPTRGPYNHDFYDSRRPPPPPHHPPFPPPYHERGRDGHRGRPPRGGDDVDPFGRHRRFAAGPDHPLNSSHGNKGASINDPRRRRSLSPSVSNEAGYHRKRSRSRSRSVSTSDSSRSASSYSRSSDEESSRRGRSRHKHRRSSSSRSKSPSTTSSVSDTKENKEVDDDIEEDPIEYSKDQRTVFVTQLVMRTTVKDLSKFFKHHGIKVNEIELLRDRRSGQHKGSAYAELKRMIDVKKALELSGQAPTFQRFPILIKESEAERNLPASAVSIAPLTTAVAANNSAVGISPALVATMQQQLQKQAMKIKLPPLKDANGQLIQAQKVYVGNLEVNVVTAQHLQLLFAPFGTLTEVQLQNGKGFAFLQFYDPKEAALAIQTMAGQVLAGRPMKTGWATNPVISINGVAVVTSNEFPSDAAVRVQNAYQILAQLTLATVVSPLSTTVPYIGTNTTVATAIPTVADARASLAATVTNLNTSMIHHTTPVTVPANVPTIGGSSTGIAVDPMKIGNVDNPSRHVLVHNMFNKDEETDIGWENDLREEFIEECGKYGTIINVIVVSREAGGKIYTSFSDVTGAQTCARSLAGRWFDRRQLRVEYVTDEQVKAIEKAYPMLPAASSTN